MVQEKKVGWRELVMKDVFDEEKQELLLMSEISLVIREYSDIFSDFDPRPYSQRGLSDDFLFEAKKASRVKTTGELELKILIPVANRIPSHEPIIKKRLHEHFKRHHDLMKKDSQTIRMRGLKLAAFGTVVLFVATSMRLAELRNPLVVSSFEVLVSTVLEPVGWFTTWTGLEQIFFRSKDNRDDYEFYEKMARAKISFIPY